MEREQVMDRTVRDSLTQGPLRRARGKAPQGDTRGQVPAEGQNDQVPGPGSALEPASRRALPLREIKLPRMTANALLRSGVQTVGQLIALSAKSLREDVAGIGAGSILAIEDALANEGLRLAPDNGSHRYIRASDRHVRNHNAWLQPVVDLPFSARNE